MQLTVFCLCRDRSELTFSLEVDPDFELQNFRALCELESGVPARESTSNYFDRDDVALQNFSRFFRERSSCERELADKLVKYQNERGGRVFLQSIEKPARDEWGNGLEAMEVALQLEKTVNQAVLDLHRLAGDKNDPHMCNFLDSPFLTSSVETMKTLGEHITSLRKLSASQMGMAEYLFDKHTLG